MKKVTHPTPETVMFYYPGCKSPHAINTTWQITGTDESPTFSPSVLVTARGMDNEEWTDKRCHSYVRDGKIEFLSDCGHKLAGQTVDLPGFDEWPEWLQKDQLERGA